MKSSLATAKSKAQQSDPASDDENDGSASPAARGAGAGGFPGMGGGAGGGMPDLASLMVRFTFVNMQSSTAAYCQRFATEQPSNHADVRSCRSGALSDSLSATRLHRAQQMMGNGGMEQLMNNPMMRQMVGLAC